MLFNKSSGGYQRRRHGLVVLAAIMPMIFEPASAKPWDIETSSTIVVQFNQFGSTERGTFERFTTEIDFDPDDPEHCKIDVSIDMASIESGSQQRDDIMRSSDFFKTDTFPRSTFRADNCANIGNNAYEAYGELTIRDVTRTVMLPFTLDITDQGPTLIANAKAELPLSRLNYNLGTSTFWKGSGIVGHVIRIYLFIEARVAK